MSTLHIVVHPSHIEWLNVGYLKDGYHVKIEFPESVKRLSAKKIVDVFRMEGEYVGDVCERYDIVTKSCQSYSPQGDDIIFDLDDGNNGFVHYNRLSDGSTFYRSGGLSKEEAEKITWRDLIE